jgi:hypothetical protein
MTIKKIEGYPKVRELQKLLRPQLDLAKINSILRYLQRSKRLEVDLSGNIIWIRSEATTTPLMNFAEVANASDEFLKYFSNSANDVDPNNKS